MVRAGKKRGKREEGKGGWVLRHRKRERKRVGERESKRGEKREELGLKLTFDTQEVQDAAWISFVSL